MNDPLLAAATHTLAANTEHQILAKQLLAQRVLPDEAVAQSAIVRWTHLDASSRFSHWRIVFFVLLMALSAAVIYRPVKKSVFFANILRSFSSASSTGLPEISREHQASLTPTQKLLLNSNGLPRFKTKHAKQLWDTLPHSPIYFSLYAQAYISEFSQLPPDFFETAHRLDPENAWFIYLAATLEAKDAVKKRTQIRKNKSEVLVPEWDILDSAKFEKTLTLLRRARSFPRYQNYRTDLYREIISACPRSTYVESIDTFRHFAGIPIDQEIRAQKLSHVIAAKASLLSQTPNTTEFTELLHDSDALLEKLNLNDVNGVIHELVARAAAATVHKNLTPAAASLGLTTEYAKLKETSDRLLKEDFDRKARKELLDHGIFENAGLFNAIIAISLSKQTLHAPPFTDADVRPSRYRDHEHLSLICTILAWLLMVFVIICVASYRYRSPALIQNLSERFTSLLDLRDHAWILLCGIILPLLYVAAIHRLTPLGGRELGLRLPSLYLPTVHFIQLCLLWITLTTLATRWRVRKRTGAFQLLSPARWLATTSLCGLAAVPIFGWAVITHSSGWTLAMVGILTAAPAVWIITAATRALLSHTEKLLPRQIISQSMLPAFMAAVLLLLALIPIFEMRQQYWFQQDALFQPNPEFPSYTPYEYKVSAQMRKELRATLQLTESRKR